jgi:acetolactate synthase small subunit
MNKQIIVDMKSDHYLLTLRAEDRPGLLHIVTWVLIWKFIPITSLTAAPTDIHDIVLITMEITQTEKALQPLLYKLENIIEVFAAEATKYDTALSQRSAYFRLDREKIDSPQASVISKYEAQLVNLYPDAMLIGKSGSEAVIRQLYNALEGPYLLGFSQTGLIANTKLIVHEDIGRIIRLAA